MTTLRKNYSFSPNQSSKRLNKKSLYSKSIPSKLIRSPFFRSTDFEKFPNQDCYCLLAELKELKFFDNVKNKERIINFDRSPYRWELLWNPIEKCLLGIKRNLLKKIKIDEETFKTNPAYQMVKIFKAHNFNNAFKGSLKQPIKFIKLGKGTHIVYRSDKWNKGKYYNYIHEFGEDGRVMTKNHGVNVYFDPANRLYKMCGGRLTVNERGIIN